MKSIEDRKKAWCDFYSGKNRTICQIEMNYGPGPDAVSDRNENKFIRAMFRYHAQMKCLEWLDDDRVPCVSNFTGTETFAHAFGSPVVYPENNNPFAKPAVFSAAEASKLKKPRLEDSTLMEIFELAHRFRKAAPDAVFQLPDIQSPLDIAALIWEKADFFMAFIDEPQAVKDLVAMTGELLTEFLDLWFKTFGNEFIAHYPDYYMPSGITLSEDEIGAINCEQFNEFVYPVLCDLSAHFGGKIGIHCCAHAKHQWPFIAKTPGLVMLNLVQPDNVVKEASVFFRDGPGQFFNPNQNTFTDFGARVVLGKYADSKESALSGLAEIRELSKKYH